MVLLDLTEKPIALHTYHMHAATIALLQVYNHAGSKALMADWEIVVLFIVVKEKSPEAATINDSLLFGQNYCLISSIESVDFLLVKYSFLFDISSHLGCSLCLPTVWNLYSRTI